MATGSVDSDRRRCQDDVMKTALGHPPGTDPQARADEEAVLKHLIECTPVPEDVARRVDARADKIIERIRRTRGVIDDATFQALLGDDEA